MSRRNNTIRKKRLKAAEAFVESWTTSGLAYELITDYDCTLGCDEAETYASLFRSFGYTNTAEQIIADHTEDCDNLHYHEPQGVWTFTVEAHGANVGDDAVWTIVSGGKDGAEAEELATEFLRKRLKKKVIGYFYLTVEEVESGVPASTALYAWTDIREAV